MLLFHYSANKAIWSLTAWNHSKNMLWHHQVMHQGKANSYSALINSHMQSETHEGTLECWRVAFVHFFTNTAPVHSCCWRDLRITTCYDQGKRWRIDRSVHVDNIVHSWCGDSFRTMIKPSLRHLSLRTPYQAWSMYLHAGRSSVSTRFFHIIWRFVR